MTVQQTRPMVIVKNLALELTERCNLNCKHCMKGEPRNIDMSEEVLDLIFSQVNIIENLFFAGGEPFLATSVIEKIIKQIIKHKVEVYQWSMTTNATIYNKKLIHLLKSLDKLCKMKVYNKRSGTIDLSFDKYHKLAITSLPNHQQCLENIKRNVDHLPWFIGKRELPAELFNEGRAEQLDDDQVEKIEFKPFTHEVYKKEELIFIGPIVFVNANGLVTACDTSYENQETKYNWGNVKEKPLLKCIEANLGNVHYNLEEFYDAIEKQTNEYESGAYFVKCKK